MVYVDGTNLLSRLAATCKIEVTAYKPPESCLRQACALVRRIQQRYCQLRGCIWLRSYWFSSYSGDEKYRMQLSEILRAESFEPILFRLRDGREKGVDIALAKEMLVNAFNKNCDIALLIAGDEDYRGLVQEVKRYGVVVCGAFVTSGLSEHLKLAYDEFRTIGTSNDEDEDRIISQFKKAGSDIVS